MQKYENIKATFYELVWGGPVQADPEGLVLIKEDTKGFDEYRFYEGNIIEDWPEGVTFFVKGIKHEDYVVVGLQWTVVSERVRKCSEELKVTGVQFLPVRIIIEEKNEEIGPYWAMNVVNDIDALDWERTKWMHPNRDPKQDEHPQLDIIREALIYKNLINIDVFKLNIKGQICSTIYLSERLERSLEHAGATVGFKFKPIHAY
jgi:hypothetical protein